MKNKITEEVVARLMAECNALIEKDHFVYAKKPDGWYHGSAYINKDAIYPSVRAVSWLSQRLAESARHCFAEVVVGPTVGAVSLSQWTAYWLAPNTHQTEVLAVFADEEDVIEHVEVLVGKNDENLPSFLLVDEDEEIITMRGIIGDLVLTPNNASDVMNFSFNTKTGTRRILKRGYDQVVAGKRCLLVEDVVNTGATVMKTRDAIVAAGGLVIGVVALCNRSGGKVTAATLGVPWLKSLLNLDMEMYPEDSCPICSSRGPGSVRQDIGKGKEFLFRKGLTHLIK